ncbi:MAG: hypothetical protein WCP55_00245 [Lentisphaerota bacterium]
MSKFPEKKAEPKKVRVLSSRPGDIVLLCGVIKHLSVTEVDPDVAAWLMSTYPEYIKRVD